MTIALRSPDLLGVLVSVDNAPVDVSLKSDFHKYVQGMRDIEDANVEKAAEADQILSRYEKVCRLYDGNKNSYLRGSPSNKTLIYQWLMSGPPHPPIPPHQPHQNPRRESPPLPHPRQDTCFKPRLLGRLPIPRSRRGMLQRPHAFRPGYKKRLRGR